MNKSSHNTRNQSTKEFLKTVNFPIVHIAEASAQLMEKIVKKYMKLKRTNLVNLPTRTIINFLLILLIFRILHILTKSRLKTLIGQ